MSKWREIKELLRDATSQGFTYEVSSANHFVVHTPDHIAETRSGKRSTKIAGTPRSDKGVTDARVKLERIGYVPPHKRHKTKQEVGVTTAQEGSEDVPKFGEVVRLKDGDAAAARQSQRYQISPLPKDQILDDVQLASWLVWEAIHKDLRRAGPPQARALGAEFKGYEWQGSRTGMIKRIWPELPGVDYSVTPPDMPVETRAISKYLTNSRNMAVLRPGNANRKTLWWVSADWREIEPDKLPDLPGNWWERKVTPEEAGETREPAPVEVSHMPNTKPSKIDGRDVYYCPYCPYRSESKAGVSTHISRLKVVGVSVDQHNQESWPCPIPGCLEIRTDTDAIGNHVSRDHKGTGLHICRDCGQPFKGRAGLIDHKVKAHQKPEPEIVQVTDPAQYLRALIDENQQMRDQLSGLPGLEKRLAELETENADLRAKYDKVAAWLREYPFLGEVK